MLVIKSVTMRNFLSCGNVTQTVKLDRNGINLVMGENLDMGGNGSRNGVGKAQPLSSKIYTPSGWVSMRDLEIGSKIYAADGSISAVVGIYPQGSIPTYRIQFSDGRSTIASGDHLWSIYSHLFNNGRNDRTKVISTMEMINIIKASKKNRPNSKSSNYLYVQTFSPETIDDIDLPIDPYLLGAMIGDGKLSNGIGFTSKDEHIIRCVSHLLEKDWNCYLKQKKHSPIQFGIKMIRQKKVNPFRAEIDRLGLGVQSYLKFIPSCYMGSSVNQRIKLLQGLIDTDGYVSGNGSISFTTTSQKLADDVAYLVRSIGGLARVKLKKNCTYINKGIRIPCRDSYTVAIRYRNPSALVSLPRKLNRISSNYQYKDLRLQVVSIKPVGEQECQCIMIDHPSHLYVTDDFIVTHNTTLLQAISFGLYGQSLTNIRVNNLVNNINQKNMMVSVEFEKDGHQYKIERGRKPTFFRYIVDDKNMDESTDEAQGESRETQKDIDRILGMSHTLFKHILALNTYTEPFLSLGGGKQREIIEELLTITLLSQKAENLKEMVKTTKSSIEQEEFRIRTIKQSNDRIRATMVDIQRKADTWQKKHIDDLNEMARSIENLEMLKIEEEIQAHRDLELYNQLTSSRSHVARDLAMKTRHLQQLNSQLTTSISSYDRASKHECPTCGQGIHDAEHEHIRIGLESKIMDLDVQITSEQVDIDRSKAQLEEIDGMLSGMTRPAVVYGNLEQALNHRNTLDRLTNEIERAAGSLNPYVDQNDSLAGTIQEVTYDELNSLSKSREHQEFLLKLLTNKDSFIRKRIIDQNLAYLNMRLNEYLDRLGLPHQVRFVNDLSVEISLHGQDLDFDNLSRGERTRLILGLSWAFRDIFENTNHAINLVFVDELLDAGMDPQGLEGSVEVLKKMDRERHKNVFIISHREELVTRVSNVLTVIKENGFTNFSWDYTPAV
jgi:DNA repair exonuclease SbcCD ATPase subunit